MPIQTPYRDLSGGTWLRGNLHAHTTHSDGKRSRQAVVDDYARRGYDFLMISDHDVYTSPEDYAAIDTSTLVLIPGNEVTRDGEHLLHVNANRLLDANSDRQIVLDDIARYGGFAVVNHPNWSKNDPEFAWAHVAQQKLVTWRGFIGIEIYNGVIGPLMGSQYALDRWDRMLSAGRRAWGFANDDSHDVGHVELGWNVVYAKERNVSSIVDAMVNGRFYASTGVVISSITASGDTIRIETENADRIVATATGHADLPSSMTGKLKSLSPRTSCTSDLNAGAAVSSSPGRNLSTLPDSTGQPFITSGNAERSHHLRYGRHAGQLRFHLAGSRNRLVGHDGIGLVRGAGHEIQGDERSGCHSGRARASAQPASPGGLPAASSEAAPGRLQRRG